MLKHVSEEVERALAKLRPARLTNARFVLHSFSLFNAYSFPLYSPTLKHVVGLSQQQLTILGVTNDLGENVGILPGIASNKYPPWVVLFIGVLASFFGYGVIWLAVSQTVPNMPYWVVSILSSFFNFKLKKFDFFLVPMLAFLCFECDC